jgi:ketosteroid isomerase-like protein
MDTSTVADSRTALLHEVYDEWSRGEFFGRGDFYCDDVEMTFSEQYPEPQTHRGLREIAEMQITWLRAWDDYTVSAEQIEAVGDQVVVRNRIRGRGKGSGIEIDDHNALVFSFRDGRIARMLLYRDFESAVKAAEDGS